MFTRKKNNPLLLAAVGLLSILTLLQVSCKSGGTENPPQAQGDVRTEQASQKVLQLQDINRLSRTDARIGVDSFKYRVTYNRIHPLMVDTAGNPIDGFQFKAEDYKDLKGRPVASLFFQVGLTNVGDSTAIARHTKKAEYTIMVVPLGADGKQLKDANGLLVAYDYVCTCVKGVGCCPGQ